MHNRIIMNRRWKIIFNRTKNKYGQQWYYWWYLQWRFWMKSTPKLSFSMMPLLAETNENHVISNRIIRKYNNLFCFSNILVFFTIQCVPEKINPVNSDRKIILKCQVYKKYFNRLIHTRVHVVFYFSFNSWKVTFD